ncbi:DMT family transporter [Oceaniglobus indicus]|uniref:DMT family transporter n=1 Tax=Oceaniglobus indicus TaxID=2047749 RepID=UPI000C181CCA|nr:DMT family transporter [Oceaniglobus indicus]
MTPEIKGHMAMLGFSALVAGSFALGSLAANDIAPSALNAARFIIATTLVGAAAWASGGVSRSTWVAPWRYLVLGGLLACYFVLMFEGLKTAPPVSAAAVFTLTPALAAGFGWLFLRQAVTGAIALALVMGAIGALWVIFRGDPAQLLGMEVGRGEMIYFWGCMAHAAYTPLVRRLNRGETATVFSFGVSLAGCVVLIVFAWGSIRATDWTALPLMVWITILYTAVFASAITFVLLQFSSLRLPSSKVMAYTYLVPVWVLLWQRALGQPFPDFSFLGGLFLTLCALGVLFAERSAKKS